MGKVYAVSNSSSGVGLSNDRPNKSSKPAGSMPAQPRVTRSKRRAASVELVFSDDPTPNNDHPLASLSHLDRERHRRLKLAEILAQAASRWARQQISNGKEGV